MDAVPSEWSPSLPARCNFPSQKRPTKISGGGSVALAVRGRLKYDVTTVQVCEGKIWGWGRAFYGELPEQEVVGPAIPLPFPDGVIIDLVACGFAHCLSVSRDHRAWTWGWGKFGQLGHGSCDDENTPRELPGLAVRTGSLGERHTVLGCVDGTLWSFGGCEDGHLGHGKKDDSQTVVNRPERVLLPVSDKAATVACGWGHSVVVTDNHQVFVWGWNQYGQLGTGEVDSVWTATHVPALQGQGVISAACGTWHTLWLTNKGDVYAAGWNKDMQLGTSTPHSETLPFPLELPDDTTIVAVAASTRTSSALTDQGNVFVWGHGVSTTPGELVLAPSKCTMIGATAESILLCTV